MCFYVKNTVISPNFCDSPETMRKLFLSTKFPHLEIRWNYNICHSVNQYLSIPPENIRKLCFSNVFRGCRMRPASWNRLRQKIMSHVGEQEGTALSGFIKCNQGNLKQISTSLIKMFNFLDREELLLRGLLSHCKC